MRVIQRAVQAGVHGMALVAPSLDVQEDAVELAKGNAGLLFAIVGIHPHSVKRSNDKQTQALIDNLKNLAFEGVSVALMGGLDLGREVALHFPQEKMLHTQIALASELKLPLVLFDYNSTESLVAALHDSKEKLMSTRIAVFNFTGSADDLDRYLNLPLSVFFVFTGLICERKEKGERLRVLLPSVPLERLLVASAAPDFTPQNIEDAYIAEQKNEPSNLLYVIKTISEVLGISVSEASTLTYSNALRFFGLQASSSESPEKEEPLSSKSEPATDSIAIENAKEEKESDDNEEETGKKQAAATYACRECRYPVCSSAETCASSNLPSDVAASVTALGLHMDHLSSSLVLAAPRAWMRRQYDQERKQATEGALTGALKCPSCATKLGRWFGPVVSASRSEAAVSPVFALTVKRLDLSVEISSASMANKVAQREAESIDTEGEDVVEGRKKKKRAAKKNVKASNRANMGNFRNKDF